MRLATCLLLALHLPAQDWPEFRGPGAQGHATGKDLPVNWSESKNIRWKTAIPGLGWSSPAVAGGRIWLTTAASQGASLRLIAADAATGKITLDKEIFASDPAKKIHAKASHASPTPIVDGQRIYVHFGSQGTAAVDLNGEVIWKTRFNYEHVHGNGGSPALHNGVLYLNCDGGDIQYVVALDAATGKQKWRVDRKTYMAFATPLVHNGEVISPSAHWTAGYDLETGRENWRVTYGDGFSNIPRPVVGHGMVFLSSGFMQPVMLGVRLGGKGDVTGSHVAWSLQRGAPHTPSPILNGDELFIVSDKGIATCIEARTGKVHWQERVGGNHSASPTLAEGRIYFLSEEGESVVISASREFRKLATSSLDGRFLASPAVVGRAIYLRSATHLYRIEKP